MRQMRVRNDLKKKVEAGRDGGTRQRRCIRSIVKMSDWHNLSLA